MNGLGGLNKSENGVVVGLVQLRLPVTETREDLEAVLALGASSEVVPLVERYPLGQLRRALYRRANVGSSRRAACSTSVDQSAPVAMSAARSWSSSPAGGAKGEGVAPARNTS